MGSHPPGGWLGPSPGLWGAACIFVPWRVPVRHTATPWGVAFGTSAQPQRPAHIALPGLSQALGREMRFFPQVTGLLCLPLQCGPARSAGTILHHNCEIRAESAPLSQASSHRYSHCHSAEVNLVNIGTFNFYVRSKELFHAHFGAFREMIARKIKLPGATPSN